VKISAIFLKKQKRYKIRVFLHCSVANKNSINNKVRKDKFWL
jgi:hypothetical protein